MPTHDVYAMPTRPGQRDLYDFNANQGANIGGYNWTWDAPFFGQTYGEAGGSFVNPYGPNPGFDTRWATDQGSPIPFLMGNGYTGQDASDPVMNPEFATWMQQNGYHWGYGTNPQGYQEGYFDKYGNPVGQGIGGSANGFASDNRAGIGMMAALGGFGGLMAAGLGAAGTVGAANGSWDILPAAAGESASAIAPELAAGLTPEELAQVQNLGTTASEGAPAYTTAAADSQAANAALGYTGGASPVELGSAMGNPAVSGMGAGSGNLLGGLGDWASGVWNGDPRALNQLRLVTGGLGMLGSLIHRNPPSAGDLKGQVNNSPYNNWNPTQAAAMEKFNTPRPFVYQPPKLARGGTVHAQPCGCPMCTGGMVQGYAAGGQADNVQINASPGEYVMDADVVSALGDGDNDAGAAALDKMRERIRAHKRSAPPSKIPPKALSPLEYLAKRKGR